MNSDLRRAVRLALLAGLGLSLPAAAVEVSIPRVGVEVGLGAAAAPSALVGTALPGLTGSFTAPTLSGIAAPSMAITAAPLAASPAFAAAALAPASAPAAAASAAQAGVLPALAPAAAGAANASGVLPAAAVSPSIGRGAASSLDALGAVAASAASASDRFDGSRDGGPAAAAPAVQPSGLSNGPSGFIKNADGVWVGGRAAEQSRWIDRMYAELSPKIELGDVMNVMDDAYDEARVKLRSAEKAAADRALAASSVHLEGTRNWVDAILIDGEGRHVAVHTHRVYFHPAPHNPASEIAEGIRRVDKYLEKAKSDFAPGGLAEQEMKESFAQVELSFDTRGYRAIEDHIRGKEAEFHAAFGDRFHFNYITEPKMASAPLRAEYNRLVELYKNQPEGLMGIIDGVTYSREVGVGHELNSHKKRLAMGLEVVQAGRDFFDGKNYITEFDAVTQKKGAVGKDRDVTLWEDKSARVWMPLDDVMEQTFLYKLRIYRDNRALIERSLGAPLKVVFSVDVGGRSRRAAQKGVLVWQDTRQQALMEHLQAIGPELSKEYGFPVSFIFVNSHPGEDMDLFYKDPVSMQDWEAAQREASHRRRWEASKNGRKHGRKSGRKSGARD